MDWDRLKVFHAVVLAGGITKAIKILDLSHSAISRHINLLEKELGVPLFTRKPRGLILTDEGKALSETVLNVFAKLASVEDAIDELKLYPRGQLNVISSLTFGSMWLAPHLQEFLDQYPGIRIKLSLKDEDVNFKVHEADIGILGLPPDNPDILHSQPIPFQMGIYASRSYLDAHGIPQKPADLSQHRLIVFGDNMPHLYSNLDWLLTIGTQKQRTPYLVANNGQTMYEATRSGLGIAALPAFVVGDDPEMVEILERVPREPGYRYLVYPKHLMNLKRVQVFIDFFTKKMLESRL